MHSNNKSIKKNYLITTSDKFQHIHNDLGKVVYEVFPQAEEVFEYKMLEWKIATNREVPKDWIGTLDPRWLTILLVERKGGITLHIWNPADYYFLDKHRALLTSAGFEVMRGCIQYNRKQPYPIKTVETFYPQ